MCHFLVFFFLEVTADLQTQGKVFILYCKDAGIPISFSEDVLDLADSLNHCGGFTCMVDYYVNVPPLNWNNWTQQQIQESQYVILVCSPTLAQVMRDPQDHMLNMEKGKYYANDIVNLIHPQKFIPVYLNGYKPRTSQENGWLPPQLCMCTVYNLNISELRIALEVPEGSPQHILYQKLTTALHEDRFREVAKLVYHLRSDSHIFQPQLSMSVHPQFNIHPPSNIQSASSNESFHFVYPIQQQGGLEAELIPNVKLRLIAVRLKGHWFNLGVKLGVESFELEFVQKVYHPTDYEGAALRMFYLWRIAKNELATKEALKQALIDMEFGQLAQELFQD